MDEKDWIKNAASSGVEVECMQFHGSRDLSSFLYLQTHKATQKNTHTVSHTYLHLKALKSNRHTPNYTLLH